MASLMIKNNNLLSENLEIADTMMSRMKGLLGRSSLERDQMIWIHYCNSIHTFFMKFSIDCVFLDKDLIVCSIREDVVPWRIVLPILKATSVVEMAAGKAKELNIQIGDQLHVGN